MPSYANAYKLDLFIYYDTRFLSLALSKNIEQDRFSINATSNTTTPGLIHFHTDVLWLLNNHFIQLDFKFNSPDQIFKDRCQGDIIVDFKYETNLAKFNGKVNTSLGRLIPYKCNIEKARNIEASAGRITVPGFSFVYDEVNNDVYVCKLKAKLSHRNYPACYMQKSGLISWLALPYTASIVGIDTSKKTVYGLTSDGKAYLKSMNDLTSFTQIADRDWTSIQDQPHVRKAKTARDVTSLPDSPITDWIFPSSSANKLWTITSKGIKKKLEGTWKTVFMW